MYNNSQQNHLIMWENNKQASPSRITMKITEGEWTLDKEVWKLRIATFSASYVTHIKWNFDCFAIIVSR